MPRKQACVFHLQGRCREGAACRFSHDPAAPRKACAFFARGSCTYGDRCRYAHVLPGQSAAAVRSGSSGSSAAAPAAAVAPAAGAAAQDGPPPLEDGRPTRAELCTCEVCGFEATLPADLLAHLKQQHAAEPELARRLEAQRQCPDCGRVLNKFGGLNSHYRDVHVRRRRSARPHPASTYAPGVDYLLDRIIRADMLGEPLGWDSDDSECEERMDNCGFTFDEVNELLCQGVKPWDDDAWDVLGVLHGY